MKLSFSTLGCPFYHLDKIIDLALHNGYQGIEIRAVSGTTDLGSLEEFRGAGLSRSAAQLRESGLEVACVGTGVRFAQAGRDAQDRAIEEARFFLEVAQALHSPYLRTFGGPLVHTQGYEETIKWIREGYQRLCELMTGTGVVPLLETHDDFSTSARVLEILSSVPAGSMGVVWDILHPYRFTEAIDDTFSALRTHIRHVHVKDSAEFSPTGFDITLVGEGKVPVEQCVRLLQDSGYEGYLSLEWEKLWHPEIAEPEVAFPHYTRAMAAYL